jgi:hypothetical protein
VISAVPTATPVTIPDVAPIVAIAGVALDHELPVNGGDNTIVEPTHTGLLPLIAPAPPLTVIGLVLKHVAAVK